MQQIMSKLSRIAYSNHPNDCFGLSLHGLHLEEYSSLFLPNFNVQRLSWEHVSGKPQLN